MDEAFLFNTGKNYQAYRYLGSHAETRDGDAGHVFRVWAPNAQAVYLCGSFNDWNQDQHALTRQGETGIWEGFRTDCHQWDRYQYRVVGQDGVSTMKADPFAIHQETRPGTASIIYDEAEFSWSDTQFLKERPLARQDQPLNIYELHLASWRRHEDGNPLNYREIGQQLAEYCQEMGYNAVELLPITEYPLDDSWGYQVSGYFAPTSRFGTPEDFKFMMNSLHQAGIRVILDWVPAHFPKDAFGLYHFDGSPCYEYADSRIGEHKEWGTMVFDYGRSEVISFLLSSAYYWIDEYHIDGLRLDAVSAMIYLDYGRTEYVKNQYGGNDNLEAIAFMQKLNQMVEDLFPQVLTIAEESTAYPRVTVRASEGGLGFTHKWNMGWMHDTLDYFSVDYYARKYHHNQLTFSMTYAFSENYVLPYSHDEVVHGKGSLIGRMPGDIWRQCASLRNCLIWQLGHPGAKLNFMGNEFGQFVEWRFYEELQWFMLDYPQHRQLHEFSKKLGHLYLDNPALWQRDHSWDGFHWVKVDDRVNSVFAYTRTDGKDTYLFIFNMTPAVLPGYVLAVPNLGKYQVVVNSDDAQWGGSGYGEELQAKSLLTTNPASHQEWSKRQKSMEQKMTAIRTQAEADRQILVEKRETLAKAYRELLGDVPEEDPRLVGLTGELAPIPEWNAPNSQAELVLDLPPLAAIILHYEGEDTSVAPKPKKSDCSKK